MVLSRSICEYLTQVVVLREISFGMDDMTTTPLVSFIVPVYNVAEYLPPCLDSLLAVSVPNEIILVNDGSTDRSLEICRAYQSRYAHIQVIDQSNQGLPGARNSGFRMANGEYIAYVDSDDWLDAKAFVQLLEQFSSSLDIIVGNGIRHQRGQRKSLRRYAHKQTACLSGKDFLITMLTNKNHLPVVWLNIYRREFLLRNDLWFDASLQVSEDGDYTFRTLLSAHNVQYFDIPFYHYRIRENSNSQSKADVRVLCGLKTMRKCFQLLREKQLDKIKCLANEVVNAYFQVAKCTAKLDNTHPLYKSFIEAIYDKQTLQLVENNLYSLKKKMYFGLIKYNFDYFKFIRKVF